MPDLARGRSLPEISDADLDRLLSSWNATEKPYPATACVHDLIDTQIAQDPDRVALVFRDRTWTYRELHTHADATAAALRRVGVRPGSIVAVSLRRSLEMVSTLLGVWRAGGAYVPLDPAFPLDRIRFMLSDAVPSAVVVSRETAHSVADGSCPVLQIGELEGAEGEGNWSTGAESRARAEDLAYILYTSGSTGHPKGVAVTHRSVVNFFSGMDALLGHPPAGVWLAITSIGFDISVLELFWTLARGFRVIIQEEGQLSSAGASVYSLPHQIRRHGVTHLQCTPSLAAMLVRDAEAASAIGRLEQLLIGGEAFPRDLAQKLVRLVSGQVFNLYGPTETTIWSSAQLITPTLDRVLIGRPLANTRMYVLGEARDIVPIGEPGELYIGGVGVAVGYLNRPELTAERFIANPFTQDPADRLYRTGDIVRYDTEGRLEFLGRIDQQVKLRGVRIELGELEVVLREYPTVADAAAGTWEVRPGDVRLVAYIVPATDATPSGSELQGWLTTRLPEAMVPAAIVILDALPSTPNGKLDRRALPVPRLTEDQPTGPTASSPLEEQIAAIWADVLGRGQVGVTDPFFAIGGHSLLAVEVQERLRTDLHEEVALVDLFRYPTVRTLAQFLMNRAEKTAEQHSEVSAAVARGQGRQQAIARRAAYRQANSPSGSN